MEAYRFATSQEWSRVNEERSLKPNFIDNTLHPIYAIPESPIQWGTRGTFELIRAIEKVSKQEVSVLMKFEVPTDTPSLLYFVQDGFEVPWLRKETRRPAYLYPSERYYFKCPEFLIYATIPIEKLSLVEFPRELLIY